jgi:Uma2 family endonuclease
MSTTQMTAEEFCEFVHREENENSWLELDHGNIVVLDPPTRLMSFLTATFSALIGKHTEDIGTCYAACGDVGVILRRSPDTVRGADVAVFDDFESLKDKSLHYDEVAPLLAVEFLSPTERPMRIGRKVADYLASGTKLVWMIDPETRTAIVYRPDRIPQVIEADGILDGEDVLPGFRRKLGYFFLMPGERRTSSLADAPPHDGTN